MLQFQGVWSVLPFNQLRLQGQMSNGWQVAPYFVHVQFTSITPHQLAGFTSGAEQAFWTRV